MRQLRKTNMEYEERNAALQKHVESMRGAVERLEGDVMQERGRNGLLHQHLETLRQALTSSFSSVSLPGQSRITLFNANTSFKHSIQSGGLYTLFSPLSLSPLHNLVRYAQPTVAGCM